MNKITLYYRAKYQNPDGTYDREVFIGSDKDSAREYAKQVRVPGAAKRELLDIMEFNNLYDALDYVAREESREKSYGQDISDPQHLPG